MIFFLANNYNLNMSNNIENQYWQCPYGIIIPATCYFGTYPSQRLVNGSENIQTFQFVPLSYYPLTEKINEFTEINKRQVLVENDQREVESEKVKEQFNGFKNCKKRQTNIEQELREKLGKKIRKQKHNRDYDPDFKIKRRRQPKKLQQIAGRNQFSNTFRAFIKMLNSKLYFQKNKKVFEQIKQNKGLNIQYQDFKDFFVQRMPSYNNYVNRNEFLKLYAGESQESLAFRVMFNHFTRNDGVLHILLSGNKKRIMNESILSFLSALRSVQEDMVPVKSNK